MIQKILSLFQRETHPDIILRKTDALLQILLCIHNEPKARIKCVINPDNSILIGDITHENEEYCKGFGSMMMEALISYAEENGHTYIFGNLSEIDKDHADRLHHFYEKFGFSITIYDESQEMYYGKIEKWICQ